MVGYDLVNPVAKPVAQQSPERHPSLGSPQCCGQFVPNLPGGTCKRGGGSMEGDRRIKRSHSDVTNKSR